MEVRDELLKRTMASESHIISIAKERGVHPEEVVNDIRAKQIPLERGGKITFVLQWL